MAKICTWVDWETYRKIMRVCTLLSKREGKTVSPYAFIKRAIEKALREGLLPRQ